MGLKRAPSSSSYFILDSQKKKKNVSKDELQRCTKVTTNPFSFSPASAQPPHGKDPP